MPFLLIPILVFAGILVFVGGDIFDGGTLSSLKVFLPFQERTGLEQTTAPPPSQQKLIPSPPPQSPPPEENTLQEELSYEGMVWISSISRGEPFTIRLSTNIPKDFSVPFTGWKLQGQADSYTIPKGTEIFSSTSLPSGNAPIFLERGDRVYISGAHNPLVGGVNFRPNECFGYLKKETSFPISVSSSCPDQRLKLEDVSHLTPNCQDFMLKFSRCSLPEYPKTLFFTNDFQCRNFYEVLEANSTYDSCVRRLKNNNGFLDNTWHIYADGEEFLREGHDKVQLKDLEGNVIDEYVY